MRSRETGRVIFPVRTGEPEGLTASIYLETKLLVFCEAFGAIKKISKFYARKRQAIRQR